VRIHSPHDAREIDRAHKGAIVLNDAHVVRVDQRQGLAHGIAKAVVLLELQELDVLPACEGDLGPERLLVALVVGSPHVVDLATAKVARGGALVAVAHDDSPAARKPVHEAKGREDLLKELRPRVVARGRRGDNHFALYARVRDHVY